MNQKITCQCCYDVLDDMHTVCELSWWSSSFVMATPFLLLAPKNPSASTGALVATGMLQLKNHVAGTLVKRIHGNQKMPSFVDAVQNLEDIKFNRLRDLARRHSTMHFRKDPPIFSFWSALAKAYENALASRTTAAAR